MKKWITTLVACVCLLPTVGAQEASTPPSQEALVERILELQRQIEELMANLPPAAQAELRKRLATPPAPPKIVAVPSPEPTQVLAVPKVEPAPPTASVPHEGDRQSITTEAAPEITAAPEATPVLEATPTPAPTPPVATAAPNDVVPKLIKRRSRRAPCNTLHRLDENGDGKINSSDRYWRYFYLWTDKNRDRQVQDREVDSAYDRKVREIAVSLETFIRTKGSLGEVRIEDQVVLDLRGDGFSERARGDDGVLVVDTDALARGNGPRLLDASGEPLAGFQPFRSGLRLELSGEVTALNCP